MELTTKRYQSISYISGPLLFVEGAKDLAYGAIVNIHLPDDTMRGGQVIEVSEKNAVIQVFEETPGLIWPRPRSVCVKTWRDWGSHGR